ncbi:MAG: hypothetical protein AAGJ94_09435 [Pseudomonadota bacterium]
MRNADARWQRAMIAIQHTHFLNVVATKRSGHHAFVDWVMASLPATTTFFSESFSASMVRAKRTQTGTAIINIEGWLLPTVLQLEAAQRDTGQSAATIVFLRDPLNMLASLMNRRAQPMVHLSAICRQVFAGLDWTEAAPREGSLRVLYGPWLTDGAYREKVAGALGFTAAPLPETVTPQGGGSSFDAANAVDAAGRLARLTRWHQYRQDPMFCAILGHPQINARVLAAYKDAATDLLGGRIQDAEAAQFIGSLEPAGGLLGRVVDGLYRRRDAYRRVDTSDGLTRNIHNAQISIAALF